MFKLFSRKAKPAHFPELQRLAQIARDYHRARLVQSTRVYMRTMDSRAFDPIMGPREMVAKGPQYMAMVKFAHLGN